MTSPEEPIEAHLSRAERTEAAVRARREAFEAEYARRRLAAAQPLTLETYRRLHEEATQRSATLRTALEAILDAWDGEGYVETDGNTLDRAITAAREVLS
jgi:macrodomain Ter protein organizer (MatP/YcbG family)